MPLIKSILYYPEIIKIMKKQYDIIIISGEPYVDHPFSGVGVIRKVLEDNGFSVAIIENPDWKKDIDFLKYGTPKLFFGVTSGSMDSMLINYTPLKKNRYEDKHSKISYKIPDRAVTVYCNKIKKLFKGSKIVIAGLESSLRRFAHYDYWDNKIRKSILLDTRADILVYGYGELQIIEIAKRLKNNQLINNIKGTCIISKELPKEFQELPSYDSITKDKKEFCKLQSLISPNKYLAQKFNNRYILQNEMMQYTQKDLDYIYSLNYSRKVPQKYKEFNVIKFSVLTHRGCFGMCNFCSIYSNSGKRIISRSIKSITEEIKKITKLPDFKGTIELSAASANMYGMDCDKNNCNNNCIKCKILNKSHKQLIKLLRETRKIPKIKKVLIKSGVRYDLALNSPEYIREIIKYHIEGKLTIAPEHTDKYVLSLMNKEDKLSQFIKLFKDICRQENKKHELGFYIMVCHPGCTLKNSKELNEFIKKHKNACSVQVFTPTPMSTSTCMYYTGLDPKTKKKIYVPYTYNEKKKQKNIAMGVKSNQRCS